MSARGEMSDWRCASRSDTDVAERRVMSAVRRVVSVNVRQGTDAGLGPQNEVGDARLGIAVLLDVGTDQEQGGFDRSRDGGTGRIDR